MQVLINDEQTDLKIAPESIESLVKEVIRFEDQRCDEVSIHFVNTASISELHQEYFDDPTTTDCISFPLDDEEEKGYRVLGEVFVCPQTAKQYVECNQGNVYDETSLYLVHGLLHIMGYDDVDDFEPEMRAAEKKHMENLRIKGLILHS